MFLNSFIIIRVTYKQLEDIPREFRIVFPLNKQQCSARKISTVVEGGVWLNTSHYRTFCEHY